MDRRTLAATVLSAAVGIVLGTQAVPAAAQGMKDDKATMGKQAAAQEKCYGINAVGKNDCAAGAHSCAGQATMARDPQSFVLLPAGVCGKIAGGKMS
jgi:uncharacterized membrane protein